MKSTLPVLEAASTLTGPGLSRRAFLELSAGGLVASWYLSAPRDAFAQSAAAAVTTRSTARNCIFVFLPGAPSQVDTWDLKEGSWTPADFQPTSYGPVRFPQGLLPKIAGHLGDISIVRSLRSHALVHPLGQTWMQIARNPTGATGAIAPHMGAVVARELDGRRGPADVLPTFIALNTGTNIVGSGYFPSTFSPFSVQPATQPDQGLPSMTHPDGAVTFDRWWADLQSIDAALRAGAPLGKDGSDAVGFYEQAHTMMKASDVNQLFSYSADDSLRYGGTTFGNSCVVARKLLAGRRGARFIQVTLTGWDMHNNIYGAQGTSLNTLAPQLDSALGALIDDLRAAPGETAASLFDETLILVAGEFGLTVGPLNGGAGRDHFAVNSALFAGGGVKGGRVIGATSADGSAVTASGVPGRSDLAVEDFVSTVYSAMGIDWTTSLTPTPVGRPFEYVPYAIDGSYGPIDGLF